MNQLYKLKKWIDAASWQVCLILGLIIVFLVAFIKETYLEKMIKQKRIEVIQAIDNEEAAIDAARERAKAREKEVDKHFAHLMKDGKNTLAQGHKSMDSIRDEMNKE